MLVADSDTLFTVAATGGAIVSPEQPTRPRTTAASRAEVRPMRLATRTTEDICAANAEVRCRHGLRRAHGGIAQRARCRGSDDRELRCVSTEEGTRCDTTRQHFQARAARPLDAIPRVLAERSSSSPLRTPHGPPRVARHAITVSELRWHG